MSTINHQESLEREGFKVVETIDRGTPEHVLLLLDSTVNGAKEKVDWAAKFLMRHQYDSLGVYDVASDLDGKLADFDPMNPLGVNEFKDGKYEILPFPMGGTQYLDLFERFDNVYGLDIEQSLTDYSALESYRCLFNLITSQALVHGLGKDVISGINEVDDDVFDKYYAQMKTLREDYSHLNMFPLEDHLLAATMERTSTNNDVFDVEADKMRARGIEQPQFDRETDLQDYIDLTHYRAKKFDSRVERLRLEGRNFLYANKIRSVVKSGEGNNHAVIVGVHHSIPESNIRRILQEGNRLQDLLPYTTVVVDYRPRL